MHTYVVTGATSFIGISLCHLLLDNGNIVYAVCRRNSLELSKLSCRNNLKVVYSELETIDSIISQIPMAEIFINLAWAGTKHLERDDIEIHKENINNTLRCIHVAKIIGCYLFVESGSQAEYGFIPTLIKETSTCNPESEYGKSKLQVYILGKETCLDLGIKHLHLRIFSVFGENNHSWTMITSVLKKMINDEVVNLTSCSQCWNYLYIRDAVKQIYLLCEYALNNTSYVSEIYNIASEDTRQLRLFVDEMYCLTQSKSILNYGVINPTNKVSLNPSIEKVKSAIGFISSYSFGEAIQNVISSLK